MRRSTDALRDLAALEHLDEDWAIACELRSATYDPPCPEPADWWLICRECGTATPECNRHRIEEHQTWRRNRHRLVTCTRCGFEAPASRWQDLFRVTPIEGLP